MTKVAQTSIMSLINRTIQDAILRFSKFPAVGLFGPRHSGKTTLMKKIFKDYVYLNFENPETLEFATQNPKAFLEKYE